MAGGEAGCFETLWDARGCSRMLERWSEKQEDEWKDSEEGLMKKRARGGTMTLE